MINASNYCHSCMTSKDIRMNMSLARLYHTSYCMFGGQYWSCRIFNQTWSTNWYANYCNTSILKYIYLWEIKYWILDGIHANTLCSVWRVFATSQLFYRAWAWCGCEYKDKSKSHKFKQFVYLCLHLTYAKNDRTLLQIAASQGHEDIVEYLLNKNVDVNFQDKVRHVWR